MKIINPNLVLALGLALFVLTAFVSSPASVSQTEYAYVKVTQGSGKWTKVIVAYPDGTTEITDLETGTAKNHEKNAIVINSVFNKLAGEGYTLVTSNGGEYMSQFVFEHSIE